MPALLRTCARGPRAAYSSLNEPSSHGRAWRGSATGAVPTPPAGPLASLSDPGQHSSLEDTPRWPSQWPDPRRQPLPVAHRVAKQGLTARAAGAAIALSVVLLDSPEPRGSASWQPRPMPHAAASWGPRRRGDSPGRSMRCRPQVALPAARSANARGLQRTTGPAQPQRCGGERPMQAIGGGAEEPCRGCGKGRGYDRNEGLGLEGMVVRRRLCGAKEQSETQ